MKTFNHWDCVVSTTQKDITLEAQVDFEDDNWKVYISEWWRNLNNPMRIVLDKKYLVKKDKKIKLDRWTLQRLIFEFYPTAALVDELDKEVVVWDWYVYMDKDNNRRFEYVWQSWLENTYLFRKLDNSNTREIDDIYYLIKNSELQNWVTHLKDVLNYIFWDPNVEDYDIDLDSNENEND